MCINKLCWGLYGIVYTRLYNCIAIPNWYVFVLPGAENMDVVLKLNGCPLVSPTYNDLMDAGRDYFDTG